MDSKKETVSDIKYFIEHKETTLWWFPDIDYDRPNYIHSFNGNIVGQNGYCRKDGWTNDPNHPLIVSETKEEAQKRIWFQVMEAEDHLIITEHLFCDAPATIK